MRSPARLSLPPFLLLLPGLMLTVAAAGAGEVANQVSPPTASQVTPSQMTRSPGTPVELAPPSGVPSLACDAAALRCLGSILVYDDNSKSQFAMRALDWCAIPYTRALAVDFVSLLTGSGPWDVVIMDMPSNEPGDGTWTTELANHIFRGGRAIQTHWNPGSLTPALQDAFQISAGSGHDALTFYKWDGCHGLFARPHPVSDIFDVWAEVGWGTDGFFLTPVGSAIAAAGFTPAPAAGQGAIVIGNGGRTVFNGFLLDDYEPADKDGDLDKDIVELIANELASFCAGSGCCGDLKVDPGEDCDSGGVDTSTCDSDCTLPSCGDGHANKEAGDQCDTGTDTRNCDSDCTLPSCGDGHLNAAAGEECEAGGIDTATCDSDCTLPVCGDSHKNGPAGEACDEGGIDTKTCNADCTVPVCGDRHVNPAAGEICDEGGIDTATCNSDCTLPVCGDRHVNTAAGEACDSGGVDTAACDFDCTLPSCGDLHLNVAAGEVCDEGGVDTAACDSDCTRPTCGDGHWNVPAGEQCDDGGTAPGDGCGATCLVEGCLVSSLSPLTLLKGVKEGGGVRFSWAAGATAAISHLNQVTAKTNIPNAWRATRGLGGPVCEAAAGVQNCLDPAAPPAAPGLGFLQVVASCGTTGDDEGPI